MGSQVIPFCGANGDGGHVSRCFGEGPRACESKSRTSRAEGAKLPSSPLVRPPPLNGEANISLEEPPPDLHESILKLLIRPPLAAWRLLRLAKAFGFLTVRKEKNVFFFCHAGFESRKLLVVSSAQARGACHSSSC